jgi:hypothetical protein
VTPALACVRQRADLRRRARATVRGGEAVRRSARAAFERHRRVMAVTAGVLATTALVLALLGQRHAFSTAVSRASAGVLIAAALLQVVALLARTEAWHWTVGAAGGTVGRRRLYRASSMGFVASILNSQLGAAARIAALRRSCPATSPKVTTLIAAELPIVAIEVSLAAVASFTLIGPLGLPWWLPVPVVLATTGIAVVLRGLGHRSTRPLWRGLAVLRDLHCARLLAVFVLAAVLAQILRNWLLLNAVGVPATPFDATAVLIAMVSLSMLPIGPSVGAGAVVLILGHQGVAAAAAAGVLATATGTAGGLGFAAWAGADRLWSLRRAPRPAAL